MNDVEAKVRCIEVAAALAKPTGDYSPKNVVNIAKELYDFANSATPPVETPVVADKSSKKRKPSEADILS